MVDYFNEMKREVKVTKHADGKLVDGEWVDGDAAEVIDVMIAIPVTPASLRYLPEGSYTTEDMRFYHDGKTKYKANDVFCLGGVKYKVKDITDRSYEAESIIYYAKRIEDDDV